MAIYGYMRVSSKDQNEARQRAAMEAFGVAAERLYLDRQSGGDFNRPAYRRLMRRLKAGDVLAVKSIDRLGRNYSEIIEQWRLITQRKGAAIVVLDMPLLDTRRGKDLTGMLIANIVLQLLSYVAQMEREFIRQRQAEGIAEAKRNGVRFGPPRKARGAEYERCLRLWQAGRLSARAAGRRLNIAHTTFLRWAREPGSYM